MNKILYNNTDCRGPGLHRWGRKCISSALKTKGKLWHRPPCQEFTVHAQAPSVDCTECRATSSDFSELPGIDISGPHDDKKNVFLLFFFEMLGLRIERSLKLNHPGCAKIGDNVIIISKKYVLGSRSLLCRHHICPKNKKSRGCFWRSTAFALSKNATGSDYLSSTPKGTCFEYVCFLCTLQRLLQIHQKGPFCVNRWSSP